MLHQVKLKAEFTRIYIEFDFFLSNYLQFLQSFLLHIPLGEGLDFITVSLHKKIFNKPSARGPNSCCREYKDWLRRRSQVFPFFSFKVKYSSQSHTDIDRKRNIPPQSIICIFFTFFSFLGYKIYIKNQRHRQRRKRTNKITLALEIFLIFSGRQILYSALFFKATTIFETATSNLSMTDDLPTLQARQASIPSTIILIQGLQALYSKTRTFKKEVRNVWSQLAIFSFAIINPIITCLILSLITQIKQIDNLFLIISLSLKSFIIIILGMLELSFTVKANFDEGDIFKIVGSIPILGEWNPDKGLILHRKLDYWQGPSFQFSFGGKFQFKIVKIKVNGVIEWEVLPNNSNRKFKPKNHSQIHLEWSQPEGKVTPLTRGTYKVKGLPAVMVNKKISQPKNTKKQQQFDPYRNARDQQSDEEQQQQFFLVRRKMSDEIVINSVDLEEIYYKNTSLQTFSGLLKKTKLYVVSQQFNANLPHHQFIQKQISKLPSSIMIKWISSDAMLGLPNAQTSLKFKKRGSLFQVAQQQLHLQSLYSRTSFFLILDLQTMKDLDNTCLSVPACLFLPASSFDQAIKALPQLTNVQLICFDEPQANKALYQYLKSKSSEGSGQDSEGTSKQTATTPSIQGIIKQLSRLRYRQPIYLNTLQSISEVQGLKIVLEPNTICIMDELVVDKSPNFLAQILQKIHHLSILIIICEEEVSQQILQLRNEKNVVIIYQNFEKIILEGKEYHPLRNFKEVLDTIRMKAKLYLQAYGGQGGQIVQKENSIIYNLPQGRQQWAGKVQIECQNLTKKLKFFKVSRKGSRVKVTWNLSKEIRILRTLCQIKYVNFGSLGNFNLVTEKKDFKEVREDIRLIIEHKSQLFRSPKETKVNYYSFGNQSSSLTIIPSPLIESKSSEKEKSPQKL